ncbi:hypothetical protein [Streptomyces nitrosporeus]|uniref:hypothetical protein n=1 Tax=Streptomyces nitrosporeus TaxID=28894 RepID=UPI00142EF524|nr:hypothetical protein [Streptomyces nitrosporeus]GGZ11628.1 hypothetical protein GCM10010327_48050 [Streptomyces nitrosporeus]
MTDPHDEETAVAGGTARVTGAADGRETASRVAAASHEWALRQAELRCARAHLASIRRSGERPGPAAGAEPPVRAGAEPGPPPVAGAGAGPVRAAEVPEAAAAPGAVEPARPGPAPGPTRSALSDLALDILTGGSATAPARTGRPEGPA